MTSENSPEPPISSRYRRWLRAYPPGHRRRHEEEMIGVLLASSDPGRRRVRFHDAVDLVRGGLAVRARHAVQHYQGDEWRDALTLVSLLGPVVLLAGLARFVGTSAVYLYTAANEKFEPIWASDFFTAPLWTVAGATAVFALLGWRRRAMAAALITAALAAGSVVFAIVRFDSDRAPSQGCAATLLLALLSAAALVWSAGPAPARALLGRRTVVLAGVAAVVLGCSTSWQIVRHLPGDLGLWEMDSLHWLIPMAGAVYLLRTAAGRRACALLLVPVSPLLPDPSRPRTGGPVHDAFAVTVLPVAVLVLIGCVSYALHRVRDDAVQQAIEGGDGSQVTRPLR